jgi:hypothetical protein
MSEPTFDEGLGDDTTLLARMGNPVPPPVRMEREKTDEAAKEIAAVGDASLVDWFKSFSGSAFKISLARQSPDVWEGRNVAGHLGNFDELIDEETIASRFGGGKFQIRAMKANAQGKMIFAGSRTFKIAGDPKITAEHFKEQREAVIPLTPIVPNADAEVTKAALASMERFSTKAVERAERIEDAARGQSPFDPTIIAMVTKPLESQIATLNAQLLQKEQLLIEKDRIIKDLSERRPDTSVQDKLLDKMYDGENAKLNALRAQHDSERRVLQENFAEEKKRMEHRSDIERQNLMEAHKRELKQLEMSFDHQLKASELSHRALLDAKENRLKDLDRTITKLDAEIVELRAKKEKTIHEQMQEVVRMKETFSALGMGGDDKEEESTVERVMGAIAENPIVQGIGRRLAQPEAPAAPAPRQVAQQLPQARRPRPRPAAPPAQAAPAPAAPAPAVGLPDGVTDESVQVAVQMMEGAVANGTDPDVFAQSIRSMVPAGVINYIGRHGIDTLLDDVARLSEASPLSTQVGRLFARRVAKSLAT